MWTHCIVCRANLGHNNDVEQFPVGDCLVFDSFRGRLWAVCGQCHRWNLTPIEERWEALESLERLWEKARVQIRGEVLAMARLKSGLRIIRVGKDPTEKEVAYWRWGRRHRSRWAYPFVWAAGLAAGVPGLEAAFLTGSRNRVLLEVLPTAEEAASVDSLRTRELLRAGMSSRDDWLGWSIQVDRLILTFRTQRSMLPWSGQVSVPNDPKFQWVEFTGRRAIAVARMAFPLVNKARPKDATIGDALDVIGQSGGVSHYLTWVAGEKPRWVQLRRYPPALRLALEIALFQDEERKALEGELGDLEFAWREAEAAAAISDGLLPPEGWEAFRARYLNEGP